MKTKEWINPNKMFINTGHKTFDRQTNVISIGNVISNTQYSSYIRPMNLLKNPVGQQVPYGYLTEYDLRPFVEYFRLPQKIKAKIKNYVQDKEAILYCFYHHRKNKYIIHGFVLTDAQHNLIEFWVIGGIKSYKIVSECIKYITNEEEIKNANRKRSYYNL
jgi:hypothetical protein